MLRPRPKSPSTGLPLVQADAVAIRFSTWEVISGILEVRTGGYVQAL